MTIAEKIAALRRARGWSQEELADRLSITRQAVSKWESGLAAPDLDRLVQLSELFGVTTDALLKDAVPLGKEPETAEPLPELQKQAAKEAPARRVARAQAEEFLALRAKAAPRMALGTMLCVWSPVTLIALAMLQEYNYIRISDEVMAGVGLCALIVLVGAAVALFMTASAPLAEYEFLEKEPIILEPDAQEAAIRAEREAAPGAAKCNTIGVALCIGSVLPMFAALCADKMEFWTGFAVCPLLVLVGAGCYLFVRAGMMRGTTQRLLETGDYARAKKARRKNIGPVSAVYWLVVTAAFLFFTFGPSGNGKIYTRSGWIFWAIAGILYAALLVACELYEKEKLK